tara:strand:+ start:3607 stop:4035 length:429 start_codon:yes stop_codon:yes gene_type:complete
MFGFFKKKNDKNDIKDNIELDIAALLIHAAKIDENYTLKEKEIIKKTLIELGTNEENLDQILISAEKIESDSNQILTFTKKIKNLDQIVKIRTMESLLKIIYSDGKSDIYEANLITRLSGLLYLDNKLLGDLKNKIKSNLKK